jgi:Cu-Zn family superoxide dismutase
MNKTIRTCAALCAVVGAGLAQAAELKINLHVVSGSGTGAIIGTVRAVDTAHGLVLYPTLTGLAPGLHGFHVHTNPSCDPVVKDGQAVAALAAGGHFDPAGSGKHGEPWGDGHLGDLPPLYVAADGSASSPVLAPRLKVADIRNRSLMVHAGGDNHADHPAPLGGGGARVACGVIPQ